MASAQADDINIDDDTLLLAALLIRRRRRQQKKKRCCKGRIWAKPHIRQREEIGSYFRLLPELRADEPETFRNFLRMTADTFDWLVELVTPLIQKEDTGIRAAISPAERLALTLRYLATGETYKSLSYQFRIGRSTIGVIMPEVCEAIYTVLKEEYMKCPSTKEEWKKVAEGFQTRWQLPNCLGALDGKHIVILMPANSGSSFFNYKGTFSIVLMALVDAEYNFLFVDVGCNGRVSDGGVFEGCTLQQAIERRASMFPDAAPFPGDERPVCYYIVADDAFALRENLQKPYSHRDLLLARRIFNYRMSRGRLVVENAFGMLSHRFRVLLGRIGVPPNVVEKIVLASCALHNMLHKREPGNWNLADQEHAKTHELTPGAWRTDPILKQASLPSGTNVTKRAKMQREYITNYFNSDAGRVEWQDRMV